MGLCDLHCHLLWGVDDGAKSPDDALEMAKALVDLGFTHAAPSPHNRVEYPERDVGPLRLRDLEALLRDRQVPLAVFPNAENFLLDERFVPDQGTPSARRIGNGPYVLVEAPYTSPVTALPEIVFRVKLKGTTPVIAHPERCFEFEKKGRAKEIVEAGALLQLDVGSLTGRYGPQAKKLARAFLDDGLYALGATDLHGPVGAREWVAKAFKELRGRAGERAFGRLMEENPGRILRGEALD